MIGLKLLTNALEKAAGPLVGLSPELSAAAASADAARLMHDIDRAERLGPGLAKVQKTKVKFELMMADIWTEVLSILLRMIEPMLPFFEFMTKLVTVLVDATIVIANILLLIANIVIPGLQLKILGTVKAIMESSDRLAEDIKDLFRKEDHTELDVFTDEFMRLVPLRKGGKPPPIDGGKERGRANKPPQMEEE